MTRGERRPGDGTATLIVPARDLRALRRMTRSDATARFPHGLVTGHARRSPGQGSGRTLNVERRAGNRQRVLWIPLAGAGSAVRYVTGRIRQSRRPRVPV